MGISVFCFWLLHTYFLENGVGAEREEDLKVSFRGNEISGTILFHNLTVICHISWGQWSDYGRQEHINLAEMDPLICTHIVLNRFTVDATTFEFEWDVNYDDNEIQLKKLLSMKANNKWLKVIAMVYPIDNLFQDSWVFQTIGQKTFGSTLLRILRVHKLDGIYLNDIPPTAFVQELCTQVRDAGYQVVFMTGLESFKGGTYNFANFASHSSISLSSLNSDETAALSEHSYPYSQVAANVLKMVKAVKYHPRVLLSLAAEAILYALASPCKWSEDQVDCCKAGEPTFENATALSHLGTTGIHARWFHNYAVMLWRVCQLYNEAPGNWKIWRGEPYKEVYMCDGRYWITYKDRVYLESMLGLVQLHNLGGVDVHFVNDDDFSRADCDSSNSVDKVKYPFVRNINLVLSKLSPHRRRSAQEEGIDTPEKTELRVKPSQQACGLLEALQVQGISTSDRHIWFCLALMESHTNSSTSSTHFFGPQDYNGCHIAKFGLFGLSSPLCQDPRSTSDCKVICDTRCTDIENSLLESVKCVSRGMWGAEKRYHRYWSYCENVNTTIPTHEDCVAFWSSVETGTNTIVLIIVTIGVVGILFISFIILMRGKRRKNMVQPKPLDMLPDVPEGSRNTSMPLSSKIEKLRKDLLEQDTLLDTTDFEIYYNRKLGRGCFGVVYGASVRGRDAAVKVLNEETDDKYLIALLSEIKLLGQMEHHENIVSFLGHWIECDPEMKIRMFLELCSKGSLDIYLREHRSDFGTQLRKEHLIRWSYQIANGMSFLNSKQVLHGDLAARNVLLDGAEVAKISDFGLSRNLYSYNYYIKKGMVPMPWRWMSIEALRDMKFSQASDVWSYGVTLYELFSLGSVPYPGLNYTPAFIDQLVVFNLRAGRPTYVDDFMYNAIIQRCWGEHEVDRPSFSQIVDIIRPVLVD